ncbi:hypothetical protein V6N11_059532 [Hibiscus sabdariffa]|uniref:Uncharacterized protein n=1 Tax=Hibiscus sabdariffa TaxID=183260 RepID=A0ABR2NP13_9ROSI
MFDELSTPIKEELDGFDDSTVVPLEDDLIKGSGEIQEFDEMLVPTAEVIDGEKINSELGEIMDKGSVFEGCDRVENMRICRQFSKVDGSHQNGHFKQLESTMEHMGEHSDVESRDGVKYKDPKSGLVTMTSTDDLRLAESVGGGSRGSLSLYTIEVSSNQKPTYKGVSKENMVKSEEKLNNGVKNGEAIKGTCMEDWIG